MIFFKEQHNYTPFFRVLQGEYVIFGKKAENTPIFQKTVKKTLAFFNVLVYNRIIGEQNGANGSKFGVKILRVVQCYKFYKFYIVCAPYESDRSGIIYNAYACTVDRW